MKDISEMTFDERLVRKIIIEILNDVIGSFTNQVLDESEEECEKSWPVKLRTKQYVIDRIYNILMNGKDKYIVYGPRLAIERKHVRFLGEKFIRELIEDRVEFDYHKYGWDFPNNYKGDMK